MRCWLVGIVALGWPAQPAAAPASACSRCATPLADTTASSLARQVLEESVRALVRECASRDADGCAEVSTLALGEIVTATVAQLQSGAHYRVVAHTSVGDLAIAFARHAAPVCVLVVEGATLASDARAQHISLLQAPLHLPPSAELLVEEACRIRSRLQPPHPISPPPPSLPPPRGAPAPAVQPAAAAGARAPSRRGSSRVVAAACAALLAVVLYCMRTSIMHGCGRALGAAKGALASAAAPRRARGDERARAPPAASNVPPNRCPRTTKLIRDCKCQACKDLAPPAQPQPTAPPLRPSTNPRAARAAEPTRKPQQPPQQLRPKGAGAAPAYSFADADAIYVPSGYVYTGTPGSPATRRARLEFDSLDDDGGESRGAAAAAESSGWRERGGAAQTLRGVSPGRLPVQAVLGRTQAVHVPTVQRLGGGRGDDDDERAPRQPLSTARALPAGPSPWTPRARPRSPGAALTNLFNGGRSPGRGRML